MKVVLLITILLAVFMASRLTARGTEPWLAVLIAAGAVLWFLATMYVRGKILAKKTWNCPNCREVFNIETWYKLAAAPSNVNSCRIRCPHCNESGWCGMVS